MSYRLKQTERGEQAVRMLQHFLESRYGILTTSVHEPKYSSGQDGYPDLVFRHTGIEVKRVELIRLDAQPNNPTNKRNAKYTYLGNLKVNNESWNREKEWCKENHKHLILIMVLTLKNREPIFVRFKQAQIDKLQQEQNKKWFCLGVWDALKTGKILR